MADENSFVQQIKFKVDDSELVAAIEFMKKELGVVNVAVGQKLTSNIEKVGAEAQRTANDVGKIGQNFGKVDNEAKKAAKDTKKQADETRKAKAETDKLQGAWGKVARAVKGAVAAYVGFQGISKLVGFGQGSIAAFSAQKRSELMLDTVLKNRGMGSASQDIKNAASAIQGRTTIGDEAMISGAAELATYVKDPESLKRMMNLLADYSMGMTGGAEMSPEALTNLATGLGKAFDGSYEAMRKKGFDTSELEKIEAALKLKDDIEKGDVKRDKKTGELSLSNDEKELVKWLKENKGSSIEALKIGALEEALKDWKGLADEFAKTDEGKIQQLKNTIGDMREEIGRQLLPVVAKLADNIKKNLPTLKTLFESLGNVFKSLVNAITDNMGALKNMADWISSILNFIGDHLTEIVAFGAGMKVLGAALPLVSGGISGLSVALKGLVVGNPLGAVAAGIAALVGVTLAASEHLRKSREDKRYAAAEDAVGEVNRWVNFKAKAGAEGYAQKNLDNARESLKNKIVDYAKMHGGAVPQEWLDALTIGRNGTKYNVNEFGFRQGNKYTHIYGTGSTGKVIDPKTGKEFDPSVYTYDPNALTKRLMDDVKKDTKGDTNITNIKYTNEITTDSDLMAKAIKENLRMLLTSNLSMITRSEGAKALAL